MKISRSQTYLNIYATQTEYADLLRKFRVGGELRCSARYNPKDDEVVVSFSHTGRVFNVTPNSKGVWKVSLDLLESNAQHLEEFGATPTSFYEDGRMRIKIAIPPFKNDLVKRDYSKRKFGKPSAPRLPASINKPLPKIEYDQQQLPTVNETELLKAKDVYNKAIDLGFKPAFDGKGRILWFDRKVGE